MTDGTGLKNFSKKFPNRLFDVGIAEQHAVTMSAGLAANGIIPVVALYSSFLQRAYDQVVHDVAMQNLHVVFAIDRAGIVGNDGETHQGVFDSAFLCQIPNMTVVTPADYREFEHMLEYCVNLHDGPICIRYPRGNSNMEVNSSDEMVELGKIIGLTNDPEKLNSIRIERLKDMGMKSNSTYANMDRILSELDYAHQLFSKLRCPIINVSAKAIEETASIITSIVSHDNDY